MINAQEYATKCHENQFRWGGEPYIIHPQAVANLVAHLGQVFIDVAWLHDVIEDCDVGPSDLLRAGFSHLVVENVCVLTKLPGQSYLDFILKVKKYAIAKAVKLADIAHNLSTCPLGKAQRDKWLLAQWIINQ